MRGFKAKALRKLAEQIYGKGPAEYAHDPKIGQVFRTDKAKRLYKAMKAGRVNPGHVWDAFLQMQVTKGSE